MRILTIIICLLIVQSCGPAAKATRKLRRAERLIIQAEALGATWKQDTVFRLVPVEVKSVKTDTVFSSHPGDTVVVEKERLRVKYVKMPGDSVYIEGECKADTVYKQVPVVVNKSIKCPPDRWKFPALVMSFLLVAAIFGLLLKMK